MLACNTAPEAGEHVLLLDEPEQARRSPVESPIAGISERALQTRLLARCKQPNIAQDAFELVRLRHGRAAQGLRHDCDDRADPLLAQGALRPRSSDSDELTCPFALSGAPT